MAVSTYVTVVQFDCHSDARETLTLLTQLLGIMKCSLEGNDRCYAVFVEQSNLRVSIYMNITC